MLKKAVFALSAVALASAPALAQGALTPANAPLSGEEMGAEGSSGIIIASDGEDTAVSR